MTEPSPDQLDEIVARVTANVLKELMKYDGTNLKAEIRLPLTDPSKFGDEASWAPWTVWIPASLEASGEDQ
ncbi:hypothetical protein [Streptomyces stackebrandtii]|uniref:hypothetical protein n=1 Tax=Streptomyces stackebrandtii TaxID=3051177 RepID=UPI0028DB10D9|nr:hypothetical protein [Streptomyces sp. DSM 40976]